MENNESDRLPQNQDRIAAGLQEIVGILESTGIPYILEGGTLLGAVREKRFLPWDDDVGIAVAAEDIFPLRDILKTKLAASDFEIGKCDETFQNCKINVRKYDARYEILGWYLKGRMRRRDHYRMPRRFLEKTDTLSFFGHDYRCPSPPEAYLRHFYGNWKVPKKGGRFFRFLCYDQKSFWGRQLRKLIAPILGKRRP
jgi:phosphorylcholine metabolism protein LicD